MRSGSLINFRHSEKERIEFKKGQLINRSRAAAAESATEPATRRGWLTQIAGYVLSVQWIG